MKLTFFFLLLTSFVCFGQETEQPKPLKLPSDFQFAYLLSTHRKSGNLVISNTPTKDSTPEFYSADLGRLHCSVSFAISLAPAQFDSCLWNMYDPLKKFNTSPVQFHYSLNEQLKLHPDSALSAWSEHQRFIHQQLSEVSIEHGSFYTLGNYLTSIRHYCINTKKRDRTAKRYILDQRAAIWEIEHFLMIYQEDPRFRPLLDKVYDLNRLYSEKVRVKVKYLPSETDSTQEQTRVYITTKYKVRNKDYKRIRNEIGSLYFELFKQSDFQ